MAASRSPSPSARPPTAPLATLDAPAPRASLSSPPTAGRPTVRTATPSRRAVAALSRQRVVGWKIAATSLVGQAHIGVDGPARRRAARAIASSTMTEPGSAGARSRSAGNLMRVAEAEFAFRLKRALPARERGLRRARRCSTPSSRCIPRSRFPTRATTTSPASARRSSSPTRACACWLIVGEAAEADWRQLDLAAHTVDTSLNGSIRQQRRRRQRPSRSAAGADLARQRAQDLRPAACAPAIW